MNADRLNRWLTLVANLGVLAGLLLVAYEIRQSAGIATAQARLEYSAGWRSVDGSRQDGDFAAVVAKSIENPESLTLTERIQLDGFYIGILDQAYSAYVAWQAGVRPNHYASAVAAAVELNFGSAYAKAWWQANRASWDDDSAEGKHRRAAYIFNFTPDWRSDWGGFLQLLDEDGHIRRGLRPTFNALNIIAVPQKHSVSIVTPFAAGSRLSITGWLRYGERE